MHVCCFGSQNSRGLVERHDMGRPIVDISQRDAHVSLTTEESAVATCMLVCVDGTFSAAWGILNAGLNTKYSGSSHGVR